MKASASSGCFSAAISGSSASRSGFRKLCCCSRWARSSSSWPMSSASSSLILLGSYGSADIAMGGFHSQAGWLALNMVALGHGRRRWPFAVH